MFQGNWTCSMCGGAITSLPFEPRRTEGLKCSPCMDKFRAEQGPRRDRGDRPPRQMVNGNWTCAGCGKAITQLPFNPKDGSTVQCVDCYKASRNAA